MINSENKWLLVNNINRIWYQYVFDIMNCVKKYSDSLKSFIFKMC